MAFDPNKPFEVLDEQASPAFDPNKPFDVVTETPEAPAGGFSPYGLSAGGPQFGEVPPVPSGVATGALRYGVPIAAGVATGGMGFLPAAAISAGAGGIGETLAQFVEQAKGEREMVSGREVAGATVAGAFVPVKVASGPVANFLANAGIGVAGVQAAKAVRTGELKAPETAAEGILETVLPVAGAALGSYVAGKAGQAERAAAMKAEIAAERRGGNVMLSEVLPQFTGVEARLYQQGNKQIVELANNLDANLGQVVAEAYKNAPRQEEIGRALIPYVQDLERLKADAVVKRDAAIAAEQAATRARVEGAIDRTQLEAQARAAALEAEKSSTLYSRGIEKTFGGSLGDVGAFATGARIERVKGLAKSADNAVKQSLGRLFDATGIEPNTGVVMLDDIESYLNKNIKGDASRAEIFTQIKKASMAEGMTDEGGAITFDGYRRIRDEIAKGLVAQGESPSSASRKAAQAYASIKQAAEDYIKEQNPASLAAFQKANAAAKAVFDVKGAERGVVDDLAAGNIDRVVSAIEKEGYGPVIGEIVGYAKAIAGTGGKDAAVAANTFVADTRLTIRDHLVDTSLRLGAGEDNASRAIDMTKFVSRLDTLRQKGLSPEMLGLGKSKDVKALARIAAYQGNSITVEQLNNFVDDMSAFGADKAATMLRLEQLQKAYELESNLTKKAALGKNVEAELVRAKIDAQEAQTVFERAQKDPLIALFNEPGYTLSPNARDNTKYVTSLLNGGPEQTRKLMGALTEPVAGNAVETARRAQIAEGLRSSAVSNLLFDNVQKALKPGDNRLVLENITNFFYGAQMRTQRDALRELLGKDAFNNLEKQIAQPIARIHDTQQRLNIALPNLRQTLTTGFGVGGALQGQSTRGVMKGALGFSIWSALAEGQYKTGYLLYVDPVFSKAFRNAAYNVDKFVNASPRNAIAYRMATQEDQQAKQPKP